MNINTMTVTELKALGYDIFAQVQKLQADLQTVNSMINEKSKPVEAVPVAKELPEKPNKK